MTHFLKFSFFSTCFLLLIFTAFAQKEVIIPLSSDNSPQEKTIHSHSRNKKASLLELPFFDDFSSVKSRYPNDSLWVDKNVLINNSFGIDPISYGVATFDGLNSDGQPYDPGKPGSRDNPADYLTSNYINLSGFHASDSIFLSFFYQPKGRGDGPEPYDSLVLQIKPDSVFKNLKWNKNEWISIWSHKGQNSYESIPPFTYVIVPISYPDSMAVYHDSFQFRFFSYGNLSGNLDHWNIDYVFMDKNRSKSDQTFLDISMVNSSGGILKRYTSMPYDQFRKDVKKEMKDKLSIKARNNSANLRLVDFGYSITNLGTNQVIAETFSDGFAENIDAFYQTYETKQTNEFDPITVPQQPDVNLLIKYAISEPSDQFPQNDTLYYVQGFHHYYAYDDGTAEAGYGIKDAENVKVAYKFEVNKPDSLRAVDIYFNRSRNAVDHRIFNLIIWKRIAPEGQSDANDEIMYKQTGLTPDYNGDYNGFVTFKLDKPQFVNGTFYVGWERFDEYLMNVGLDQNYPDLTGGGTNENLFYNVDGTWKRTTQVEGALMIRPYVSNQQLDLVNIKENDLASQLSIFPNPVSNFLHISGPRYYTVDVFDINGQSILHQTFSQNVDLNMSGFRDGLYLVKITDNETFKITCKKILVSR